MGQGQRRGRIECMSGCMTTGQCHMCQHPDFFPHSQAWSRRITQEHRLVYRVTGDGSSQALEILQCRSHY
ncbi:MAG: type II toxin-antitoxin system YoeB family toxin [Pontixanthobacter sp.]